MYVHPAFKTKDAEAWAFVERRGFGTLIAVREGRPVAAHVPFVSERAQDGRGGRIELHVARANPIHEMIAANPDVLLTVTGPDAYVSPDWYVSAEQVPTWNYVAVHLTGRARVLDDAGKERHVERLSEAFEARLLPKRPWTMSKVAEARKAAMLQAIVAVDVAVTGIEATRKLSQNKPEADRAAVMRMLDWQGDWASSAVAQLMKHAGRAPGT